MNAALLNALSAAISDNPVHILQLRKIVVALAISGRLDQADVSNGREEILASLEDVKRRLVSQKVLSKQKPAVAISGYQLPEDFSDSAKFVSLGQVARVEKGKTGIQQAKPGPYPLVVTAAERTTADHFDFDGAAAIIPLVSSTGHGNASINRLHYQEGQFALGTILVAVLPHEPTLFSARFLFEYLSAFKEELLVSKMSGTANVTLTLGRIEDVPIPLVPPVVQQQVDELMALCDELEAARTEREGKRDRLAAASLARLNTPDPETFPDDARFSLDALPALTARPDQIKQLRQTILNLAVCGKLVPQDPADEPAEELLKHISVERAERARDGDIPKPKATNRDIARLSDSLPVRWTPIALGDVCDLVTSGSRGWGEYYATSGPGFVRAQNIRFGRMRLDDLAYVRPPSNSEGSRTRVYRNDLLIVITGAGVTNPALLEEDLGEAYVSQHVGLVRPSDAGLSPWLLLCLMADAGGRGELLECAYGAGKPGLNLDNIRSLSVPFPPLAEQHRIVAKVDELMALCDQLEASLTSADETRRKLLDVLLAEALAPVGTAGLQEAAE